MARASRPLPHHCSKPADEAPIDRVVVRTRRVAIGKFRCPVEHPSFNNSGPASDCIVVFPRTSVRIRHEGSQPFLADPSIVTIYNRAQRYERFQLSPDGDHCDWFAVVDDVAREIAATFDATLEGQERPFRLQWAPCSASLYLRQRLLLRRAAEGEADALEIEEGVMSIIQQALAGGYDRRPVRLARRGRTASARRELAEATRVELLRTFAANRSVQDIATAVGSSPYHLCRVFRACTGRTMHAYRTELRVRAALDRLEGTNPGPAGISAIALDLGFASHSHFVRAVRHHFGVTPSALRSNLSGNPGPSR